MGLDNLTTVTTQNLKEALLLAKMVKEMQTNPQGAFIVKPADAALFQVIFEEALTLTNKSDEMLTTALDQKFQSTLQALEKAQKLQKEINQMLQ